MVVRSASADIESLFPELGKRSVSQTFVSNQPYLGSLYKSQNGSVWEPSQWEDLKFTIYRADFVENGSIEVYSPELSRGNNQIAKLLPNSISLASRSVRIGIGSTLQDEVLTLGNTIVQMEVMPLVTLLLRQVLQLEHLISLTLESDLHPPLDILNIPVLNLLTLQAAVEMPKQTLPLIMELQWVQLFPNMLLLVVDKDMLWVMY